AEGLLADHDAAAVVLDGGGENLRRAGAVAVHQHDEGAVVDDLVRARIVEDLHAAARLLELHDRSVLDEEAAELLRLREVTAAVGAQIHDEADNALGLELANQPRDIARRARVLGVAAAPRREVLIEARHGDDADLQLLAVHLDRLDRLLRGLLLELHLVADEGDDLRRRAGGRARGQHLQPDRRAARAANDLHDVVEPPADHVDELAVGPLRYGRDAVLGLELPVDLRPAARDHV